MQQSFREEVMLLTMISFSQVNKYFGTHHVLRDINLQIEQGEVVVVIGPSGSGKSTLIRCINHMETVSNGELKVNGIIVHARDTNLNQLRKRIGMVFQHFNLYPHMKVIDNITLAPMKVNGVSPEEARATAMYYLEKVGIPEKAHVYPSQLSGGQQQRVAIARALATRPAIILADEPVASLDPLTTEKVMNDLKRINQDLGITIVVNLHSVQLAREYGTRIIGLRDGGLVFDGPVSEATDQRLKQIYGSEIMEEQEGAGQ